MPDRAAANALVLARQRLRAHLNKVAELAGRGNIPAARMTLDDAMHDLDTIQGLLDELDEDGGSTDGGD